MLLWTDRQPDPSDRDMTFRELCVGILCYWSFVAGVVQLLNMGGR